MGRILFFLLLAVGLYVAIRLWGGGRTRGDGSAASRPAVKGEEMVRCDRCGLNVPESEAIRDTGKWYCSDAHRRLGRDAR
jgi:uncharacterized protein